jgi:protein-arginine kinase activator protein McsA
MNSSGDICQKCGTSVQEILETGFVGCENCYKLPQIKRAVDAMFEGKTHKE